MTPARLRELLDYDPATGVFTWRVRRGPVQAGQIAGVSDGKGYVHIGVDYKQYYAHRLAWLHIHGAWPIEEIDHRDGDTTNNCIANLREATRVNNAVNTRVSSKNTTGFRGVIKHRGKFRAQLRLKKKQYHLGYFDTAQEASAAYEAAALTHFGNFKRS